MINYWKELSMNKYRLTIDERTNIYFKAKAAGIDASEDEEYSVNILIDNTFFNIELDDDAILYKWLPHIQTDSRSIKDWIQIDSTEDALRNNMQ